MFFKVFISCAVFILILTGTATVFADDEQTIKSVTVDCEYAVAPPGEIANRLNVTLLKTLEKILVENDSRSMESYIQNKTEIERSIIDGLNIVLEPKGYSVESLDLEFGEVTNGRFKIKPFLKYVKEITIGLDAGNFHPFWASRFDEIFRNSRNDLNLHFEPLLKGMPVDAEDSDWAFNLVRDMVYNTEITSGIFPEMEVEINLDIGETTSIIVKPKPRGNLVKTFRVRALSHSLFQMTLDPLKELITSHSNMVVGMPVDLVKKNHTDIETEFSKLVNDDALARRFNAQSTCRVYFLEKYPDSAFLAMETESRSFHLNAEAIVDIGNDKAPAEFESHIGVMIGGYFECFVHLNFFPDDIRFNPDIGIGLIPIKNTFIATGWDTADNIWKLYVEQQITPYVHLEIEAFDGDEGQDQYGIVYKPFQSVAFGIFSDGDDDYWLRASFAF